MQILSSFTGINVMWNSSKKRALFFPFVLMVATNETLPQPAVKPAVRKSGVMLARAQLKCVKRSRMWTVCVNERQGGGREWQPQI